MCSPTCALIVLMRCLSSDQGALSPGDLAINFYAVQGLSDRSRVLPVCALNG